jgi:hypothetical protein
MTPTAASMKDHRLVGADSQVGSVVFNVCGRVAMRRIVMRQMRNPMENKTTSPILLPEDMLRRDITGIGRTNIARSVTRFETAFVHLRLSVWSSDQLPCVHTVAIEC